MIIPLTFLNVEVKLSKDVIKKGETPKSSETPLSGEIQG